MFCCSGGVRCFPHISTRPLPSEPRALRSLRRTRFITQAADAQYTRSTMKACLSLTLLCLITFAYGGKVAEPRASENPVISAGERSAMLMKAEKAIGNLQKILQGETGLISMEELQNTLRDLQDPNLFRLNDTKDEYILPIFVRLIGQGIMFLVRLANEARKAGK